MNITQVKTDDRIDARDDMKQFVVTFDDGTLTQFEARDMDEAIATANQIKAEREEAKHLCEVCGKHVMPNYSVILDTYGVEGFTVMHPHCFDEVWKKHTDGLKAEDINHITNEIMDMVRATFNMDAECDTDDELYSFVQSTLKDKLELFIIEDK